MSNEELLKLAEDSILEWSQRKYELPKMAIAASLLVIARNSETNTFTNVNFKED